MEPRIKVTSRSFSNHDVLRQEVLKIFPNTSFNREGQRFQTDGALIDYLQGYDGIILGLENMNQNVLSALPEIKIIAKYGVGLDNVDVPFAESLGKTIGWTPGTNRRSVSELTLAFMLGLYRNVFTSGFYLKQGNWVKDGGAQLTGKTVGIVGCGNIGTDVLRLLQPFGCNLLICDILDKSQEAQTYGAQQVELDLLLKEADVVTTHVPLDDTTRHMINEKTLSQMKPTAFLVNTSRGPVVEQNALKQALIDQRLAGAALDVFETEPPTDQDFLNLPNLIGTPHIGGNAKEAVEALGRAAIGHLKAFFSK